MDEVGGGPHGCAAWASAWGEDEFGVWAEIRVEVGAGSGESGTGGKPVVQRMRWIPPGAFWMGSGQDDPQAYVREKPRHKVVLTRGFWLGDTAVTQEFFRAVMGENPSQFAGEADSARRPVEMVDWLLARTFHLQLEARVAQGVERNGAGTDGLGFRFATEAEWEYACRSGTTTPRYGPLIEVAWYGKNSGDQTHPVGRKAPSPWGLYDMLGNVWEWCADGGNVSYPFNSPVDPISYAGPRRSIRGGSWDFVARCVRAAYRGWAEPRDRGLNLGFRLARGPALPPAPEGWVVGE